MALSTRAQLVTLLNSNVLTGGNRTTAQMIRDFENAIIESLINHIDDVNTPGGYLGIDAINANVDISFIKATTPTASKFLRDDGTWQVASAGVPSLDVVLGIGSNTNGIPIFSQTSIAELKVDDSFSYFRFDDGFTHSGYYLSNAGLELFSDVLIYHYAPGHVFTASGDNVSVVVRSPSGYYYPSVSWQNQGGVAMGAIIGYGGALYIGGAGGVPLVVTGSNLYLPLLAPDQLLYNNAGQNLDVVTIGTGLSFSGGVLSATGTIPGLPGVLAVDGHTNNLPISSNDGWTSLQVFDGYYLANYYDVGSNVRSIFKLNAGLATMSAFDTGFVNVAEIIVSPVSVDINAVDIEFSATNEIKFSSVTNTFDAPNNIFSQLSANRVVYLDALKNLITSSVTDTELGYLSGSVSNIQNQINNITSGLSWKVAARVLCTTNINIASPGASLDSISMVAGERAVLNGQSTGSENGVYVWNGAAVPMTRALDCDTAAELLGMTIAIEEGTSADQIWILTTNAPITVGVTTLTYAKSSATTYTGSNGITLTGNNFTLDNAYFSGAFTLAAGVATIGAGYVTNAMLAGSINYAKIAAMTSAEFATLISNETGSGLVVFNSGATLSNPIITNYIELNESTAPSTPTNAVRIFIDSSNRLCWKGENGFVRTFDGTANTADRVYTLQDRNGIIADDTDLAARLRRDPLVTSIVSNANPTVNSDTCDFVTITALAVNITSMTTNLTGTPGNGRVLTYRIKDDGTARTIGWGASFENKGGTLPPTTVAGKVVTVGLRYDTVTAKFGCVAVAYEA